MLDTTHTHIHKHTHTHTHTHTFTNTYAHTHSHTQTHTHTHTHIRGANVAQRTGTWVGMDGVGCGAGSTALHLAAGGGHLPVVKILVRAFYHLSAITLFHSALILHLITGNFILVFFWHIMCSVFTNISHHWLTPSVGIYLP